MLGFDIGVTWQWLIAGLALMALEIMLPGVFLLWFGIAAIITSVVAFFAPDAVTWQVAVFAVCSVVSIFIFSKYVKKASTDDGNGNLNRRAERYIGKKCEYRDGKVQIADGWWLASSDDELKDGDKVEVVGVDGSVLKVKKV